MLVAARIANWIHVRTRSQPKDRIANCDRFSYVFPRNTFLNSLLRPSAPFFFSPWSRFDSVAELGLRGTLRLRQFVRQIDWRYLVLFGVLANVPMWVAGSMHKLGVAGWFNLDFFVVGVLSLFLPRAISAGLLLLAIFVDFLAEISSTYYIAPADILGNARETANMPPSLIAQLCAGALLVVAIASAAFLLPKLRRRLATAILLAASALLCRSVNALEDHWPPYLSLRLHHAVPSFVQPATFRYERPSRSSTRELLWERRSDSYHVEAADETGGPSAPVDSAAAAAYRWMASNPDNPGPFPDFVLILMESWGNSTDPSIRQSLVQPYEAELGGRFTILQGTVPFHGATISGENRELCGLSGGRNVMVAPAKDFRNCLPDTLRDLGFHTLAIHGNHGSFYRRKEWYPRAGFEETWFKLRLESAGLPDCIGVFRGVCDAAIAQWIGKRLEHPDPAPRFIYWVTLNSHLPVPNPPALPTLVPCDFDAFLASNPALCNWYRLILNAHQSIASLAAHTGPRPAIFVIVGDHSPPFSESTVRDTFDQSAVPYVILLPNHAAAHNRALASASLKQPIPR